MAKGTVWTVEVAEISDPTAMRGTEFPTFGVLGEFQMVTTGEGAARIAAVICSQAETVPGVYRVRVGAPTGYGPEQSGIWHVTITGQSRTDKAVKVA